MKVRVRGRDQPIDGRFCSEMDSRTKVPLYLLQDKVELSLSLIHLVSLQEAEVGPAQ